MRQIPREELRPALQFEILQLPRSTLNNVLRSHPDYRYPAADEVVRRLVARMEKWEILEPKSLAHPAGWLEERI